MTYSDDVGSKRTFELPVLVIDDVKSARAIACDMLKDLGFNHCLEASDGFEALEILKHTQVQLILCDFIMEGMSGVEFLYHLQNQPSRCSAPVIFVSALGDVSSVEAAMQLGANDYLVKPVSFRKFRRKVEGILGIRCETTEETSYVALPG